MSTTKIKTLPRIIIINDYVQASFARAAVLVRQGFIFSPDATPEIYTNGFANLTMVLGSPDDASIAAAEVARAEALEMESVKYERDVQTAAKAMLEQAEREAKAKAVAAEIAATKARIAALEASIA
jgi:glycine/serine hydroxymethyltransferase